MRTHPLLLACALIVAAAPASGQVSVKKVDVGAHVGWTSYDKATALDNTPFVGIDATYRLGWNPFKVISKKSDFGVGMLFTASRPITQGDQFPAVLFDFGDTSFIYKVPSRMTQLQYGLQASAGFPMGNKARIYGMGGGGWYTMFLDQRQELATKQTTAPMWVAGGGLNYNVNAALGLRLEGRLFGMRNYNRDNYDVTVKYIQDARLRDVFPAPVPAKSTPMNTQFSLVFTYIPGQNSSGGR
ncbi:MAG: porin family protein [Gemmatimonadaceae bacterium]|nr:porin family protein [Gemmatimonadaceae bacterium]